MTEQPMPRYAIFAGSHYYPEGGAADLVALHTDLKEAINSVKLIDPDNTPHFQIGKEQFDWVNILDVNSGLRATRSTTGWRVNFDDPLADTFCNQLNA